ncbi:APC amino acid permease [Mycena floridula]|nr:APC amino acid permease [Mycena floridula]
MEKAFDRIPDSRRQLGIASVVFLIFNRIIGTGIFATPSVILKAAGSVGVALCLWCLGGLFACAGTAVYVELGTGLPRNGGEKNYLEFIYRRPKFLVTCVFTVYALIMGSGAPNSLVFGEYVAHALDISPTKFNIRTLAILCLTGGLILHGCFLKLGLRVQNVLGMFKIAIISAIAIAGLLSLLDVPGFKLQPGYEIPNNFQWGKMWEGSGNGVNSFVTGMYNVIWSFIGYSNANYALSEVRDPVKTIKRAAPLAIITVTALYLLVNIAYFAVVSKADILSSRRVVAALFFRNLFGPAAEKVLSVSIALSVLGNNLAVQFTLGRVIQELGREGVLPFPAFFASNKPFNAPFSGMFAIYVISCYFVVVPPPGDAYLFMLSLSSYSAALINTFVALGLVLLYTKAFREWDWNPPFRAPRFIVGLFFLSNVFLVLVPFIPPAPGSETYERLPYWSHAVASIGASLLGVIYWYIWSIWLPRRKGYKLERDSVLQDDGVSRYVFRHVPISAESS